MSERMPRPQDNSEQQPESARGKELMLYTGPSELDQISEQLKPWRPEREDKPMLPVRRQLPEIETSNLGKLNLTIVDQSFDARAAARDVAAERLTRELNEGTIVRRVLKGIWKGSLARGYYREKYTREAQKEIIESGDIHLFEEDVERSAQAKLATIERFQSEYDEAIHERAGEHREEADSELASALKELIRKNIEGELSDEAMVEEKNRLYADAFGDAVHTNSRLRIDNLADIAAAVKSAIEHGETLEAVLENMRIQVGESRSGVRTETHRTKLDAVLEKYERSKLSLIPPELIAGAASVALSLTRTASARAVMIPGVSGAVFAGLRENRIVKDERAQHMREMASGDVFDDGAKRRTEMDETTYHMESVGNLIRSLEEASENEETFSSPESMSAALQAIGIVEARVLMSDDDRVDLIAYSADRSVEAQRLDLDIARAKLKAAIRRHLTPDMRSKLKINENDDVSTVISKYSLDIYDTLTTDRTAKDQAFRALKRRRVVAATAKGAAMGLVLGLAGQELAAGLDDSRQGVVERLWDHESISNDGAMNQTLLENVVDRVQGAEVVGSSSTEHIAGASAYTTVSLGRYDNLRLPNDLHLDSRGGGSYSILDAKGNTIVEQIEFDRSGNVSPASLVALNEHGLRLSNDQVPIEGAPREVTRQMTDKQFVENHKNATTHIKRDFWFNNNTPNAYEKNELRLDWAGKGVDTNGSVHMTIAGMTEGGSVSGKNAANWLQEARRGDLKLAVSASKGTQNNVFMINVRPNGQIDIPSDSPAAKLFGVKDGRPVFRGGYVEAQQVAKAADGITHVRPLATLVGENDFAGRGAAKINDTIKAPTYTHTNNYTIESHGNERTVTDGVSTTVEAPSIIPLTSRRAMEITTNRRDVSEVGQPDERTIDEQPQRTGIDTDQLRAALKGEPTSEEKPAPKEVVHKLDTSQLREALGGTTPAEREAPSTDNSPETPEEQSSEIDNVNPRQLAEIFGRLSSMPTREKAAQDIKSAVGSLANDAEVNGLLKELSDLTNYAGNEPKAEGDLSGLVLIPSSAEEYKKLSSRSRRVLTTYMHAGTRAPYEGRHRRP